MRLFSSFLGYCCLCFALTGMQAEHFLGAAQDTNVGQCKQQRQKPATASFEVLKVRAGAPA